MKSLNVPPTTVSVSLPTDEELRAVIGSTYDSGNVLNVIKMMAGTDDMYPAAVGFIRAMFAAQDVDPKIREMIMLRAAKVLHCPYEWGANVVLATNVGLSNAEIEATGSDEPVTRIHPDYVLICRATDELSLDATLTDSTLSDLLSRFGSIICRKLILIIGWFNLLARFLNGCRVPMEDFTKLREKTDPLA